ncbi:VOC family protein [Parvularcula sp. ZS-1/3]|uniref:VOC family protein n=1 Tax=Parvularcula mediterranea TaxID=2732508 RepID=A0A7Y3RLL0_9PROT|nr:VOC family protein [Parvularcula mediterranea]NNU16336.1 VOC family protein [Parvularcula mediterranea]
MKMYIKSVMVDDQQKALDFYTGKLGFEVKHDIPMGQFRWLTLVSPEERGGTELALEPNQHDVARQCQEAMKKDGIPWTAFSTDDIEGEVARLKREGVGFTVPPTKAGDVTMAILDDTCGNLIQLIQLS